MGEIDLWKNLYIMKKYNLIDKIVLRELFKKVLVHFDINGNPKPTKEFYKELVNNQIKNNCYYCDGTGLENNFYSGFMYCPICNKSKEVNCE